MKKALAIAAATALSLQLGQDVLTACGAKFLVATRNAKLQRLQRAQKAGNILLYQHSNAAEVAEDTAALGKLLKGVGHQVTVAAGEPALRDATRTGGFNLVIAQLNEARRLKSAVLAALPDANILPVVVLEETSVQEAAKQEFGRILNAPARTNDILSAVEAALK